MAFNYNNEVIDLLFKKTLGTTYTTSNLVPGQEIPLQPKIHNEQIYGSPLPDDDSTLFEWGETENVAGGGTKAPLINILGTGKNYIYIKKYENIPLTPVPNTNGRAWQIQTTSLRATFQNVILGKSNFTFTLSSNLTGYDTIYSSNSSFKPIINNGVLVFLGNTIPHESTNLKLKESFVYEGEFGAAANMSFNKLTDVFISDPSNGQPLIYNSSINMWEEGIVGRDFIPIKELNDLLDVSMNTTLEHRMTLRYDVDDLWKPGFIPEYLNDLSDVDLSGGEALLNGTALVYQNGKFVPKLVSEIVTGLDFIPDVDICANKLANNMGLVYDESQTKWVVKGIQPTINYLSDISGIILTDIKDGNTIAYNDASGNWQPKEVGAVINVLDDLLDVDLNDLESQLPKWEVKKKIESSDMDVNDNFGSAVTMDISFAVVASYRKTANVGGLPYTYVGTAYVYKRGETAVDWTENQKLAPSLVGPSMRFGSKIAMDSNNIVVTAPYFSYIDQNSVTHTEGGAIFVYTYNENTGLFGILSNFNVTPIEFTETARITPTSPTSYDWFGSAVDVNGDYIIVSSIQRNAVSASKGEAYIYKYNGSSWAELKKLSGHDSVNGDEFGQDVAINDAGWAFVSSVKRDSNKGAVYIFKKNEGGNDNWGYFQKVMLGNAFENDNFGYSISANTKSLIVGAVLTGSSPGEAYLIAYNDAYGTWGELGENFNYKENSKVQKGVRIEENGDYFGSSISIGNTYGIIGSNLADISGNSNTGVAYIIQDTGEGYWEVRKRIISDDLQAEDEFGFSVGLSGRYAIVGAWLEDEPLNGGAAYILNIPEMEGGPRCLIYDQDTGRWKAGTITSAGAGVLVQELDDLTNVEVSGNEITDLTATNGQALVFDAANNRWIPGNVQTQLDSIGDITGVDTADVENGYTLVYNDGTWKAQNVQAEIASINDIPNVYADNPSEGDGLVYSDASGGWIIGEVKGSSESATGVIATNIRPETSTPGDLFYDTSHNIFYARLSEGWRKILMQNTPLIFGQPGAIENPINQPLMEKYVDRLEITWLNPEQNPTGIMPVNAIDLVGDALYLPVINDIKFEFILASTNSFSAPLGGTINIGGKAISDRVQDNRTMQTISQATTTTKLTNKIIIYTYGHSVDSSLATNWTKLNTEVNGSYEYDYIEIDSDGNQVYHFNPRSQYFTIQANTEYSFRFYLTNSLSTSVANVNYRTFSNVKTFEAESPTQLKVASPGLTNGFHASLSRTGDIHKISININPTALTGSGVSATSATSDMDSSVFFESFEVQYRSCDASNNVLIETANISSWTVWTDISFNETNGSDTKTILAETPLQPSSLITNTVSKTITLQQNDNKFYQFRVRAKNNLSGIYGPWTSEGYTIRFTKPQKLNLDNVNCSFKGLGNKWYGLIPLGTHKSSNGGISTNDDIYYHSKLKVQEYRISMRRTEDTNYTIVHHMLNTAEGVSNCEYILGAGYNGPEEGNMSENDSSVAYTGTVNNYRANPVFRFKVEARNWLFGTSGSEIQWSTISEQTAILQPLGPSAPYNKKMKFYEMNTKDVSGATIRHVDDMGTEITSESIVNIIDEGGNKYVFNNNGFYEEDYVWSLRNGVYTFKNIPQAHPMAILNNGKLDSITYIGDSNKLYTKEITSTTSDGTYDFYYGDITVTVTGDFDNVSIYCFNHGYMGGKNLLVYQPIEANYNGLGDAWDPLEKDYLAYEWNSPANSGATGLTIEEYSVEYEIGLGRISSNTINFEDILGVNHTPIEIDNDNLYYFKIEGSDTIFEVESKTNHQITFTNSESFSGVKKISAVRYTYSSDKSLGANSYYLRVYDSNIMKSWASGFTYKDVKAYNFFSSISSSGFSSPSALHVQKPNPPSLANPHKPVIQLTDNGVIIKVSEPSGTTLSYVNGTNYTPYSISINQYKTQPYINDDDTDITLLTTEETYKNSRGAGIFMHSITADNNKLYRLSGEGKIKYSVQCNNVLINTFSDVIDMSFKVTYPEPVDFSKAPYYEWDNTTNKIKLILRPSEAGLTPSISNYTDVSYNSGTIVPISEVVGLTEDEHIYNSAAELEWAIKANDNTITNIIDTNWQDLGEDGFSNNEGYNSGNEVIPWLGVLTEDTVYKQEFGCRNKYNPTWVLSDFTMHGWVKVKKPNPVTFNTSRVIIPGANIDGTSDVNYIDCSFNRPTEPGLFAKHDGNKLTAESSMIALPQPNIYEYKITINTDKIFNIYGDGNNRSDASSNPLITSGLNGLVINPDTTYTINSILAYNWYYATSASAASTTSTVLAGSVPNTVGGISRVLSDNYKFNLDLSGNYNASSEATNYKKLTIANNVPSLSNDVISIPKKLIGTNSINIQSSTLEHVIINAGWESTNNTGMLRIWFDINGSIQTNIISIGYNSPASNYTFFANGENLFKIITTSPVKDIYHAGVTENKTHWYKVDGMKIELIPTGLATVTSSTLTGQPLTITAKFQYTENASPTLTSPVPYDYVLTTNQLFDSVDAVSSLVSSSIDYTPYNILGIPSLRNQSWGGSKDLKVNYVVDNRSKFYVMNNFIGKLDLSGVNMVAKNKVFGDYTPNWSSTAISGTADSFKLSGLHSVTAGEDISGNYSNEITVKIQHQNIEGSSFDIMKNGSGDDYKFIFDPETYSILDSSGGSRDLDDVVVSAVSINTASNDSGFDSNHLMSLTILNGPDIFDPSNATTMINQVNDWTYDKIDVTKDVQNSNRMVLYKGKFLTPASLESEFTGITTSYYHNNLTSTLTNYSKVISNNDFVIPSNKDVFKDNYKWQFYKYKWKNIGLSNNNNVYYSQIYLGDDTNTNIELSDLLESTDVAANVVIMIKSYDVNSANSYSTIWESPFFLGIRGSQGYRDGQLSTMNILTKDSPAPASVWTLPGGVIAPSMGQTFTGVNNPSPSDWKNYKRVLPFAHKKVRINMNTSINHVIAIGLRKDKDLKLGHVYAGRKYQADTTMQDCYRVPP
jgi:hypothetical protein